MKNTLYLDRDVSVVFSMASPRIVMLSGFLGADECDQIVKLAETRFADSAVVDPVSGKNIFHPGRTSQGACLGRGETAVIRRVEERIAAFTEIPTNFGEALQLQKYGPGHEYQPHFDWFDPAVEGFAKHLVHGGQRQATMIMYLTDVVEGGATIFPRLNLSFHPKKGSALFFMNVENGVADQRVFHGGAPVITGSKVVANKWLRTTEY